MFERSSLTLPEASLPELWGGEVGLVADQMSTNGSQNGFILTPTQLNKGSGLTDTLKYTDTVLQQFYKRNITESITPQASISKGAIAQTLVFQGNNLQLNLWLLAMRVPFHQSNLLLNT
ncbi:hypothetical protein WKK05_37315 (plasmid) [Nostoc sp. UHCC 0302]|uniref:hypothetical protein n=1 Tax=Nostoc sp. UHCC 0302 TaxID=3134896 RepID=UPI00311CCD61